MDASGERNAGVHYYPLALHASTAIAYRTTGAPIGALLNTSIVFFAAFVFPLGLFALARHLVPAEPLVAGFAAILGSLITMFPYQPNWWGLIPLTAGVALVPITIVLLVRTVSGGWSRAAAVMAGLVVAGGFALHNSQLPLIVVLAALVFVFRDGAPAKVRWRDGAARFAWIGVAAVIFLVPTVPQIIAGGAERSAHHPPTEALGGVLAGVFTLSIPFLDGQVWLMVVGAGGVIVLLRRRRMWGAIAGAALIVGLTVAAATTDDPITRTLTFPWYRDAFRINYNLAIFVALFGGVLLGVIAHSAARHVPARRWALPAFTVLVLAALVPVGAAHALRTNHDLVATWYDKEAPVHADEQAAFEYMHDHLRQGESVLTDGGIDGAAWMYTLKGLNPVFGFEGEDGWSQQFYLRDHADQLGDDLHADALVRRYRVRFIYLSGHTMRIFGPHVLTFSRLRSAPHLEEVFDAGGTHVFEVDPAIRR